MNNILFFPTETEDMTEDTEAIIVSQIIKETPMTFSNKVEDLVWMKDISYIEAVAELTDKLGYEPQNIPKLLTPELKIKLQHEAEELSLIKKTKKNRLDI